MREIESTQNTDLTCETGAKCGDENVFCSMKHICSWSEKGEIMEKTRIEANKVTIRQMSGRKCHKVYSGDCKIVRDQITPQMLDIPEIDENGFYNPDDFCRGLAAKYLYCEDKSIFRSLKCTQYSCGHIYMQGDGNHRMCILKHLGESIEVEIEYYDSPCSECEKIS